MTRAYLLEDFSTDLEIDSTNLVIALRPEVAHELERRGIAYKLMADCYSEEALRAYGRESLPEFQKFCEEIDATVLPILQSDFFKSKSLTQIFYSRLRYLIHDFIIRSRILQSFLKEIKPSEIYFVPEPLAEQEASSMFEFQGQERDSFRLLLKEVPLCRYVTNTTQDFRVRRNDAFSTKDRGPSFLKRLAKSARNFHAYEKQERFYGTKQSSRALFLDAGTFEIDFVIQKAMQQLEAVFLFSDGAIWQMDSVIEKKVWALPLNGTVEAKFHEAFKALSEKTSLWDWIENQTQMNLREILLPYFEHWITEFLPEKMHQAESLKAFFESYQIDHLIARAGANTHHMASFIAASEQDASPIKTCFQHGMGPYMQDYVYELELFDHYFASDELCANYFENHTSNLCQVHESTHYLQRVSQLGLKRKATKTVLFLPRHLSNGFRHFQAMGYPFVWYYELQKALIELFAKRDDYRFIYKYSKGQPWIEKTLLVDIKSRNLPHLKAESEHFWKYLPTAGRMIQDYPSSPLYESAAAGVPVLGLYFKGEPLVPEAKQVFGKSLQPFTQISEAVACVDQFLSEDTHEYTVPFPALKDPYPNAFFSLETHEQKA